MYGCEVVSAWWHAGAQVLSAQVGAQDLRAGEVAKQLWRSAGKAT